MKYTTFHSSMRRKLRLTNPSDKSQRIVMLSRLIDWASEEAEKLDHDSEAEQLRLIGDRFRQVGK